MVLIDLYLYFVLNEFVISLIGFGLTLCLIPVIVTLAWKYNLVYLPNNRTSHIKPVPAIGGIAVFLGFFVSGILLAGPHANSYHYLIGGVIAIFIIGVLDDLIALSAKRKLLFIVLIAFTLTSIGDIRLVSLHHFLGIDVLPYWVSISLSVLLITYVINAVNLIDGIDGNAGITGIFVLAVFSTFFMKSGYTQIIGFTFPIIFAYAAFLVFNLFGRRYKIFMGDTGSLILGFVIAITIIKFCNINSDAVYHSRLYSPLTVLALMIVPLFDQLHVFIKRIMMGKSPFEADRNHLHHTWLKMGFSHSVTSLIMLGYGVFFLLVNTFLLIYLPIPLHIITLIGLALAFWHLPERYLKQHSRKFVSRRFNYRKKQMREPASKPKDSYLRPLHNISR